MNKKVNRYNLKDTVSFERSKFFGSAMIRGRIISVRYVNYQWVYLVECCDDKKLMTVREDDLWLLEGDEK